MTGGFVLDQTSIEDFARLDADVLRAIETLDLLAQAVVIPATCLTEALTRLESPQEAEHAQFLAGFGGAITEDLTPENAESVAIAYRDAASEATLGMAHSVAIARQRSWPVLTTDPKRWERAYPDVEIAAAS
jgi:hypothetical protein